MARSEEAAAWTYAVYNAVREVPYGKVTSYGHIARLLGKPECPRQVGVSLKALLSATAQPDAHYNNANVPWQRVINSKGAISPRSIMFLQMHEEQHLTMTRGVNGARQQATAIEAEGVQVTRGSLGEYLIDFSIYGWFPDRLPSDLSEDDGDNEDDEE
ncbi:DNA binding methylated-DNA--cysteine S-methyltransferase, partial [Aureobasidium melanogenum]